MRGANHINFIAKHLTTPKPTGNVELVIETPVSDKGGNKMDIAGYRVRFTNWKNGKDEYFFRTKEDAKTYAAKFEAYGYKAVIESIWFQEVA